MSEGKPLLIALGLILLVGTLLPLMVGEFVDFTDTPEGVVGNIVTPMIEFIDDGVSVLGLVSINPFGWLGDALPEDSDGRNQVQLSLIEYLNTWAYVPSYFAIPFFILSFVAIIYSIVKLLPTT